MYAFNLLNIFTTFSKRMKNYIFQMNGKIYVQKTSACVAFISMHQLPIKELKSAALKLPEIPNILCCLDLYINRCLDHLDLG